MRKLKLRLDEIQVASFPTDAAAFAQGTILANQTEPASVPNPCTGGSCTYPVQLCRTCRTCFEGDEPGENG
ncbi:hypothetical protein [Longimicrobium sp.]|uniref:hypothetical protein n=1 Tax=Longimicrobium sp. TaxID=2029185 RepID=UPI002C986B1B|nr:hypothetical protein [Longimicrobium sp.]HSU12708.1 hypothetical protein [Longimicrobium sp.]